VEKRWEGGTESGGPVWNRKYLITGHYMARKGSFSGGHSILYLATDVQGKEKVMHVQTSQAHEGVEV
jgi:hypothetical protein